MAPATLLGDPPPAVDEAGSDDATAPPPAPPPARSAVRAQPKEVSLSLGGAPASKPVSYDELIRATAKKVGIPEELALAVAQQESNFKHDAVSPKGARGVMQLMPDVAAQYQMNPDNPVENVQAGVQHLRTLLDRYQGDVPKALAAYNAGPGAVDKAGGIPNIHETQDYVQKVSALIQQHRDQAAREPFGGVSPATTTGTLGASAKPAHIRPTTLPEQASDWIDEHVLSRENQRLVAGGAGALAGTLIAPEAEAVAGLPWLLRLAALKAPAILGAAGGGGIAGYLQGGSPTLSAAEQAGYETTGQLAAWPLQIAGRRLFSGPITRSITESLSKGMQDLQGQWTSKIASIGGYRSPSAAGKEALDVIQGPAKQSLDNLGRAVRDAANSGPDVDWRPVKDQLARMAEQRTPSTQAAEPAMANGGYLVNAGSPQTAEGKARLAAAMKAAGITPGTDHPLPGLLGEMQDLPDTISFADAHKYKKLLDDAVSWDSPAKKTLQQVTKGARGAVRQTMAGYAPYDHATAAYGEAAPKFNRGLVGRFTKTAIENPEGLIAQIKPTEPTKLQMLWDVFTDHAAQGGDPAAGRAAKDAVRSAWTYRNLIKPGLDQFPGRLAKADPEFLRVMYDDPDGRIVLDNLKRLSDAWQHATGIEQSLSQSTLAKGEKMAGSTLSNAAHVALWPHRPLNAWRITQIARSGVPVPELIHWASLAPTRTQLVVKALTGPAPGIALADLARGVESLGHVSGMDPHAPLGGPAGGPPLQVDAAGLPAAPGTPPPSLGGR